MTPPDYTVLIQIANFLILLFLLNIIAYRPIRRIIYQRKDDMASMVNITEEWGKKAEKFAQELEINEAVTRKEGQKEKEGLKNKGFEDERAMLQEVYSNTEENLEKARQEIQERLKRAQQSLQAEVDDFSQELAKKILGRAI
jgi:F-type H+-transporting ATPase subunit b